MSIVVLQRPLISQGSQVVNALPPVPPPAKPTHLAIHNPKKASRLISRGGRWLKVPHFSDLLRNGRTSPTYRTIHSEDVSYDASSLNMPSAARKYETDITANHLLTLLITKRKICLFEASTGDEFISREQFLTEHIETARLLYHSNLSHSGVPVHPLQFQR
ncbi:hypothetical protein COOONC_01547 [Cooperia oncophora]